MNVHEAWIEPGIVARVERERAFRPDWWVEALERELRATDPRALRHEPVCPGKHYVPSLREGGEIVFAYLPMGGTCPYCGWFKKAKSA